MFTILFSGKQKPEGEYNSVEEAQEYLRSQGFQMLAAGYDMNWVNGGVHATIKEFNNCKTCGNWVQSCVNFLGECTVECETTTIDHACEINSWIPKND
jgi:hypothetical protein